MSRIQKQKLPRGRRSGLAVLIGVVVLALAILAAVAAFQIATGHDRTALGDTGWVADRLRNRDWSDVGVLVAGIVLAALGVVLLLAGLFPARRSLLRLSDLDPHTISGIARRSLKRDLAAVAAGVDGAASARVRVRRTRVVVTVKSALRDRTGLREAVGSAVEQRVTALAPARPLSVSTRVVSGGA